MASPSPINFFVLRVDSAQHNYRGSIISGEGQDTAQNNFIPSLLLSFVQRFADFPLSVP